MKPAIIGISGGRLGAAERALLVAQQPLGVILFGRNVESPGQLAGLVGEIRALLPEALLMVDQEGGRVARLRPPHWGAHPAAARLPNGRAAWLQGALIGLQCAAAGFDVVAAPVLDVGDAQGHDVIGDRAFSHDPALVAEMGAAMAAGLLAAGMQPVGKHAPGHGRARADSHVVLPELAGVTESDLLPFRANRGLPWLMSAHIRYTSLDMDNPATLSPTIIRDIIRGPEGIGFAGGLISDDLAMGALSGPPEARALAALAAGCDVALFCSGVLAETQAVLAALPEAGASCLARVAAGRAMAAASRQELDAQALAAERAALLA